ncbi:MAG: DUF4835 family protein [Bacteroidetes bacterium]|nr:DUF4835 family protein [Bacteroidota bacterium]
MKHLSFVLFLIGFWATSRAQEFNAQVEVVHPSLQTTVEDIFESLESSITNFLNGTRFTEDEFEIDEKIELSVVLNITSMNQTNFSGDIQVAAVRPIYDHDYSSPMFRIKDDEVSFTFEQNAQIQYVEGTFTDNLSSILSFYALLALGIDYDSFEEMGGTSHFNKALQVANAAQSGGSGWAPSDKERDNRYWLIFQMLDERFKNLRKTFYTYHRDGLDQFTTDSEAARAIILTSLESLTKVHENSPNSYLLQIFMESKRQEIINIFSKATTTEKKKLYQIMGVIDIANVSKYKTQLEN